MSELLNAESFELNKEVNFINFEGKMVGKKLYSEVLEYSEETKHDLILIKEGEIPLIKAVNYGKILYEQKKAQKKQRQNIQENKEIRFGLNISQHDFDIKLNKIKDFLKDNVKVKVTIQMEGRMIEHPEFAMDMMDKVISNLEGIGYTEDKKVVNGRFLSMNFNKVKETKNK